MDYLLHILILICLYIMLSVSLNIISGYTGMISIAHAAFFGIGAYVAALTALYWHAPFWLSIVSTIIAAGLFSLVVGIPSLRLRGDYFVITTFAFQIITFGVLNNWVSVTGGPLGLSGIPQPAIFGWKITSGPAFLLLTGVFSITGVAVLFKIAHSPFGRVLKAIREDEGFALAMGKNVAQSKILAFVIGGTVAAIAGSLYAYYISFIDPTSFNIMESVFILSIVIIGGAGSIWGSIVGAVTLVLLPETLRFVGFPDSVAANLRQITYGVLLVAFMIWRPHGLMGEYSLGKGWSRR